MPPAACTIVATDRAHCAAALRRQEWDQPGQIALAAMSIDARWQTQNVEETRCSVAGVLAAALRVRYSRRACQAQGYPSKPVTHHRAARRRHRHGYAGATLRRTARADARQAGGDREQARRGADARSGDDRRGARPTAIRSASRPRARWRSALCSTRRSTTMHEKDFIPIYALCEIAARAGGRSGAAGEIGAPS